MIRDDALIVRALLHLGIHHHRRGMVQLLSTEYGLNFPKRVEATQFSRRQKSCGTGDHTGKAC